MGFHSMLCEGCGHPALCDAAVDLVNQWMTQVVVICKHGDILNVIEGSYDGYGGVWDGESDEALHVMLVDYDDHRGPTVWHRACWTVAGSPVEWRGESEPAPDQGWFFDPEDHHVAEPKAKAEGSGR
jgi:hypothetical protein